MGFKYISRSNWKVLFSFAAGNPVAMTTKGGLEMKDGGSTGCLGTWIQIFVVFVAHDFMFIAP